MYSSSMFDLFTVYRCENVCLCVTFTACMYLNGVRWWGSNIKVKMSNMAQVNLPRQGVEVSYH